MDQARLIDDPALDGAWNMSVDQALLATAHATGQAILRFYRWSPATLSLGYFQSASDRLAHESSRECNMVRRVTGGGAILHDRELTYSLCIPSQNRLSGEHQQLYQQVHAAVIDVLSDWGISAALFSDQESAADKSRFLCFERRTRGDIVLDGFKVGGSAQRRLNKTVLQHGSILLARSDYSPELIGIHEIAGVEILESELVSRLVEELASRLGMAFRPSRLSPQEQSTAHEIQQKQFGHYDWTNRR